MTKDNNYLILIPCFLKFDAKLICYLALITSGLGLSYLSSLESIILIAITTCLMSILSEGCNVDLGLYSLH